MDCGHVDNMVPQRFVIDLNDNDDDESDDEEIINQNGDEIDGVIGQNENPTDTSDDMDDSGFGETVTEGDDIKTPTEIEM